MNGFDTAEACARGNSGRHPANCREEEPRASIIALKQSGEYAGATFTHLRKPLLEREKMEIPYGARLILLKNAGIESKRTKRGKPFKGRERRSPPGEPLKADASRCGRFGREQGGFFTALLMMPRGT
ncbi:MAG: hypothetical protein LBU25_00540 [Treponema sp.]|nr:hypothetical protein [Treponema sp.]